MVKWSPASLEDPRYVGSIPPVDWKWTGGYWPTYVGDEVIEAKILEPLFCKKLEK